MFSAVNLDIYTHISCTRIRYKTFLETPFIPLAPLQSIYSLRGNLFLVFITTDTSLPVLAIH